MVVVGGGAPYGTGTEKSEQHVVDLVLTELPKLDPADETFEAKDEVLSELVEHTRTKRRRRR
jgi:hypothetical protein